MKLEVLLIFLCLVMTYGHEALANLPNRVELKSHAVHVKFSSTQKKNLVDDDNPNMSLNGERIMFYTPHLFNSKYFGFEFGFMSKKKIESWDYPYHAFARAVIAEEFYSQDTVNRAGSLGFKGGVIFPTNPWAPIFIELAFGFSKTSFQKDPWFGERDDRIYNDELLLLEGGLIYRISEKLLTKISYQLNNVDYFEKEFFVSIGLNY